MNFRRRCTTQRQPRKQKTTRKYNQTTLAIVRPKTMLAKKILDKKEKGNVSRAKTEQDPAQAILISRRGAEVLGTRYQSALPRSLTSPYTLVERDWRIYENVGLVGDARLLFFVFTRGHLQVVDLRLYPSALWREIQQAQA